MSLFVVRALIESRFGITDGGEGNNSASMFAHNSGTTMLAETLISTCSAFIHAADCSLVRGRRTSWSMSRRRSIGPKTNKSHFETLAHSSMFGVFSRCFWVLFIVQFDWTNSKVNLCWFSMIDLSKISTLFTNSALRKFKVALKFEKC